MVKVAVAGGSGQVAREVIDALVAFKKHDVTILSRCENPTFDMAPGVHWKTVDYHDAEALRHALGGVHTLLSFVQTLSDPGQTAQRNLIDAAIGAGVKRFAPSEYSSKSLADMPWSQGKQRVREYLEEVNRHNKALEYTLFQPGLFLDYLAYPHKTAKYLQPLQTVVDFQNKRAMIVEGHEDAIVTLTTMADLAAVVARAVEYEGEWPTVGGISGNRLSFSEIIDIGTRVRGSSFAIEKVKVEDLEGGQLNTSWGLEAVHQAVPDDQAAALLKTVSIGILLSSSKGQWGSSDEMNQLFPDYKFTKAEDFLRDVWKGRL